MTEGKFAQVYAQVRGGKAFLIGLMTYCGIWLTFHYVKGWDADFGTYNMILSTEASVSLAAFAAIGEKQYKATMALLQKIDLLLESIKAEEDVILEEVRDD